jgi:ParB-like chromosome segregation protein Spo0J
MDITIHDQIVMRRTADLVPYARNARTHTGAQVAQIMDSIREFGWTNPVLIDAENDLIAGHGRVLAAHKLRIEQVPCLVLSHLTPTQARAYRIVDNQLALNAGWDTEMLRLELGDLKLDGFDLALTGFGELELASLMAEKTEGLTDPDDAPAPPEHTVSRLGDLWLLGRHRLLCGDATSGADVERVGPAWCRT